jgi:Predicted transmembrane transcriptional regulator (anti-sigma factor)
MNCEEANRLLDLYLDRELDPDQSLRLEGHLSGCPECRSLMEERREFQSFFRSNAPVHTAPPQLRTDVLAIVRRERLRSELRFLRQPWIYAAAALVVILATITILVPDNAKEVSGQAVARHTQSLSASRLVDIASSDEQVLQPWFAARLHFTPPLAGLQAPGYILTGGRTDVIQNRQVATLVYRHGENIVTLFCWPPNDGLLSKGDYLIRGYNVCTWGNTTCNYIVVSKLDKHELVAFVDSLRARAESGSYF